MEQNTSRFLKLKSYMPLPGLVFLRDKYFLPAVF